MRTSPRPSPHFHALRSAYQAELDDLATDSEGRNVLAKRLADKRSELGFLLQTMAFSPEMLAVVLHQAFRFKDPSVMSQVISKNSPKLPAWRAVSATIDIAPWADGIVQTILKEPEGDGFMVTAAALEYMHHSSAFAAAGTDSDPDTDTDGEIESEEEMAEREREEAGNDWMAEQGFDRKDAP